MKSYDTLIIGGGMAGVSVAYELAADRSVGLIEMESTLAFHTTGRSAATFLETYGGPEIRALTVSSRRFLADSDFFGASPLSPLPYLLAATEGSVDEVRRLQADASVLVPNVVLLDQAETEKLNPILRPGWAQLGMLEPDAMEIDVHAVHQGYRRGLRGRGGDISLSVRIVGVERTGDGWLITDSSGEIFEAAVVVNAAGSWVDEVAVRFGLAPIGIRPLRRSIFTVTAPPSAPTAGVPMTADAEGTFYLKPEGPQFLCSPAEEVLQPPSDARPDELEIARALEAINEATTLNARAVRTSWAGLRNFVPDRVPVVGFDGADPAFFWLAGQGGYGIQTAPAMARVAAALVRGEDLPADVQAVGLKAAALSPSRPGRLTPADH